METDEFRLGSGHGIRNPFLEKDKEEEKKRIPEIATASGKKSNKEKLKPRHLSNARTIFDLYSSCVSLENLRRQ